MTEKDPPASWAASQTGPREQNEDDYGRADQDTHGYNWVHRGCLYLLADGMGGLDAGKEAAQTAVRQVIQEYRNNNGRSQDVAQNLTLAMQNANQHLYKAGTRSGKRMGSTMVACVLKDGNATIAHAGDSRAYHLANGELRRLTRDHLYATEVQGIKDDDEAKRSPEGNKITRALGKDPELQVDINKVEYIAGDRFLLCSDGISEVVSKEEIGECLRQKTPEKAVHALCSVAEGRLNDNATAVVVFVSGNKIRRRKTMQQAAYYAAAVVLLGAVLAGGYEGWKAWQGYNAKASAVVAADKKPDVANGPEYPAHKAGANENNGDDQGTPAHRIQNSASLKQPTVPQSTPERSGGVNSSQKQNSRKQPSSSVGPTAEKTAPASKSESKDNHVQTDPAKDASTKVGNTDSQSPANPGLEKSKSGVQEPPASRQTPQNGMGSSSQPHSDGATNGQQRDANQTNPLAAKSTTPTGTEITKSQTADKGQPTSSASVKPSTPPTPAVDARTSSPIASAASSKGTVSQGSDQELHIRNNTKQNIEFRDNNRKFKGGLAPGLDISRTYHPTEKFPTQICWKYAKNFIHSAVTAEHDRCIDIAANQKEVVITDEKDSKHQQ
jgi:protein phosphatase